MAYKNKNQRLTVKHKMIGKNIVIAKTKTRRMSTSMNLIRVEFFNLSEGTKNFLTAASPGQCIISLNNSVTAIKFVITPYEEQFVFT